jgi:predicted Zn-dependent protease
MNKEIMKKLRLFLMSIVAAMLVSCGTTKTVPITGRQQNLMVSDEQVLGLSLEQYSDYMKSAKPSTNKNNTAMVKRVGQRIANAVESYLKSNGMAEEVKNYSWEFNLVQDNQVNAWCMPGGKIVVYEGLLPVTKDEASLAIVMGHEIAHAVARHSAERLSNTYKEQYGAAALSALLSGAGVSAGWQQLASLVHQYGGALFTSGFSRKQESEADHMGLIFAAMAGYNPQVAVEFWQRMSSATGGGSNSLFADHPSDAQRIKQIQGWMPEAMQYFTPKTSGVAKKAVIK